MQRITPIMLLTAVLIFLGAVFPRQSAASGGTDTLGPTYPIVEPDMLQEIQNKLKSMERSGRLGQLQREAIARSRRSIESPRPVEGLRRTTTPRTFFYDPSWRVPQDITAPDGKVIARAGDLVNPLDYVSMSTYLLFFDGHDPAQTKKAADLIAHYGGRVKAIMVAGAPLDLTRKWKRQIYFDQGGALVRKFGISQVPALVSQEQKRLRIDEMLP
jgi:conjugal transfer pilus assembly protein TraW